MPEGEQRKPGSESAVPGLVILGGLATGVAGLLLSVVAFIQGREIGAGLFLLAAAVAFGSLAKALFLR